MSHRLHNAIKEFFELPEEDRKEIIAINRHRKEIIDTKKWIDEQRFKLNQDMEELRNSKCKHPLLETKYLCKEDEYGRAYANGSYTSNNCPDCGKFWLEGY